MKTFRRVCEHGKFLSFYPHIIDASAEMHLDRVSSFFLLLLFLNTCKVIFCLSSLLPVLILLPVKGAEYFVHIR